MSRQRQDELLAILLTDGGAITAADLAGRLGVTARTVRSYVTALNDRAGGRAVLAGPAGYRAGPAAARPRPSSVQGPHGRRLRMIADLLDHAADLHELAERHFVSEATVEADLSRIRALAASAGLDWQRRGSRVEWHGDETARRRLIVAVAQDGDAEVDFDGLAAMLPGLPVSPEQLTAVRRGLGDAFGARGYRVNAFALAEAALQVLVAVARFSAGRRVTGECASGDAAAAIIAEVVAEKLGVALGDGDLAHLSDVISSRAAVAPESSAQVSANVDGAVRGAVADAAERYRVALDREEFLLRLGQHVEQLVHRAWAQARTRNPLTRSLKSTHPFIFELAVSIAGDIGHRLGVSLDDDEIAYIAMHVGGEIERVRDSDAPLTAAIVSPGYYELHKLLRERVRRSLGQLVTVTEVITRSDPDWAAIDADLVLTTIAPPQAQDRTVMIQPFLTESDVERISQAAARVRRGRRLSQLRADLERYFSAEAFVRGLSGTAEEVIRQLGGTLVAAGVIDEDYILGALERERLSSTAFTDALAVPHALRMTARRTAIAIGFADQPIAWGDGRVQVVALAAFAEDDRQAFQTVFEQFVEVFAERANAQRLIRKATDFTTFLDELVAVIGG